jgi:hypothetical protein
MSSRYILLLILGIDALVLFLQTSEISISVHEASLLYGNSSFLQTFIKTSLYLLGQNDLALRLPMIILHILSAVLLYKISSKYLKDTSTRVWLVLIFILLPGVISSAILVDSAGFVIFGLLLFVYIFENYSIRYSYFLLAMLCLLDGGFIYLFSGMLFFSAYTKNKFFFIYNIVLLFISLYLFGINAKGLPEGHFLDAIGLYAAVFTPIIFIYLFYVLYRRALTKEVDVLWFLSSSVLLFSLVISVRQRIEIEQFAPYFLLALPLAAQTFVSSYKVRLKIFRTNYKIIFYSSLVFLFINSFVVFFNKELFIIIKNPKEHFAYKVYVAKELAEELKKRNIYCINAQNDMSQRLEFYGVTKCNTYLLKENIYTEENNSNVTISYRNKVVYAASVTKISNK